MRGIPAACQPVRVSYRVSRTRRPRKVSGHTVGWTHRWRCATCTPPCGRITLASGKTQPIPMMRESCPCRRTPSALGAGSHLICRATVAESPRRLGGAFVGWPSLPQWVTRSDWRKPAARRREVRRGQLSIGSLARARRPRHSHRRRGPDSHGAFGGGNPNCPASWDIGEPAFEHQLQIQRVVGPCSTGWKAVPRRTLASTCRTRLSVRTVIARGTRCRPSSSPVSWPVEAMTSATRAWPVSRPSPPAPPQRDRPHVINARRLRPPLKSM
jgi:hypothetical protein